jgi:hypothetical protein
MKTVLKDHPCWIPIGGVEIGGEIWPRPKLCILNDCRLGFRLAGAAQVLLTVLLDTGNDVTIVRPDKVAELESLFGVKFPVGRSIPYGERGVLEPAYDLDFVFPGDDYRYLSRYGFIAPASWNFDVADVWLGQDIFSQLIVTFNGPERSVTVLDPNRPA